MSVPSRFTKAFYGRHKQHAFRMTVSDTKIDIKAYCDGKEKKFYTYPEGATCKTCIKRLKTQLS